MSLVELRDDLPLPLAQLIGRAANAKSILERHQCTFYVGEVALKLAASIRTARWLAITAELGGPVAGAARKLVRASLGHWQELLRESDRALGGLTGGRLEQVAAGPAAGRMIDAMVAADLLSKDAGKSARKAGLLGVFDALVVYRNAVIGHGAARVPGFYQEWTRHLGDALAEALAAPALLGGQQLVVADRTEEGERRWRLLRGPSPLPWDSGGLGEVADDALFVVGGGAPIDAAPLIYHRAEEDLLRDRVTFLQEVRAQTRGGKLEVRRLEYLDYVTGETIENDPGRDAMATLLGRLGAAEAITAVDETPPPPRLEPGGTLGGFDLLEVIGRGGQGAVFRARQRGMDRLVALKVLRPEVAGDDHVRRRFEREVRALVRSDHPNVVKVFVAGEEQGTCYYAMELIDGEDLAHTKDLLDRLRARPAPTEEDSLEPTSELGVTRVGAAPEPSSGGPDLGWRRLAALFAGAADGVDHLHERGIVHRDLKPGNLLLTRDARRLVVTDLGLARLADASQMTRDTGLLGTLRSMAPEQLDGGAAATRPAVDIFGLGVALFEAATGKPMRDGQTDAAVVVQIITRPPRADRTNLEVPRALADVIARALEPAAADRYPSAKALAAALRGFAEGAVVSTPRSRRVVLGVAIAATAVLGGGAALALGLGSSSSAKKAADAAVPVPLDAAPPLDAATAPPGMALIPGATVDLGSTEQEIARVLAACEDLAPDAYCGAAKPRYQREALRSQRTIAPFYLDVREATRTEVAAWLSTVGPVTGMLVLKDSGLVQNGKSFSVLGDGRLPAVRLTWLGAQAYCRAQEPRKRLPTEDEWELAARGPERREFPWGDERPTCTTAAWGRNKVGPCPEGGPSIAGDPALADVTREGVRDLGGNVAEWTAGEIVGQGCPFSSCVPIRGVGYRGQADLLRGAGRMPAGVEETFDDVGVRCARSLTP